MFKRIVLPLLFGLNGVFLAWPLSDFLSFIVTLIFLILELKLINKNIELKEEKASLNS